MKKVWCSHIANGFEQRLYLCTSQIYMATFLKDLQAFAIIFQWMCKKHKIWYIMYLFFYQMWSYLCSRNDGEIQFGESMSGLCQISSEIGWRVVTWERMTFWKFCPKLYWKLNVLELEAKCPLDSNLWARISR